MAKLSQLKVSKLATVPLEYNGQAILVTYRPDTVTAAWLSNLTVLQTQLESGGMTDYGAALTKVAEIVCQLIVDWDVTEDDDKGVSRAVPFTVATVADLPIPLIMALVMAAVEGIKDKNPTVGASPPKTGHAGSRVTSSQTANGRKTSRKATPLH